MHEADFLLVITTRQVEVTRVRQDKDGSHGHTQRMKQRPTAWPM